MGHSLIDGQPFSNIAARHGAKGDLSDFLLDPKNDKPLTVGGRHSQIRAGSNEIMQGKVILRQESDDRFKKLKYV